MQRQIMVIGLGRFGASLARTLSSIGHEVLAVDKDRKRVQAIASDVAHAVEADAADESALQDLGVKNFSIAIVTIASDVKSSVLCTLLLKKLEVGYVIARAGDELHGNILQKIGADTVVFPEQDMGTRLARGITLFHVSDYMSVVPGYGIAKLKAPKEMVGTSLSSLGFGPKGEWDAAVLMIQREKEFLINPDKKEKIKAEDILFVAANHDDLEKMLSEVQSKEEKNKKEEA